MHYHPDKWLLVEMKNDSETVYKVFASFYGGFADGDSWKLNSGVAKVEKDGDRLHFFGYSGSVYVCHKDMYGAHMYGHSIVNNWEEHYPAEIRVLPEDEAMAVINNWV